MSTHSASNLFYTFHNDKVSLPVEISTLIVNHIIADARPQTLGGGVSAHSAHHPIASVSRILRSIYLNHTFSPSAEDRTTTSAKFKIGEALTFTDLRTLTDFFENGPGQDNTVLHKIRFLSISYLDDHNTADCGRSTHYAYEAFEYVCAYWVFMQVCWLELCLPYMCAITTVDDPGVWSLLKIRTLSHLAILGPRGCITPEVRRCLKARTGQKKLFPWRPLGLEQPGEAWTEMFKRRVPLGRQEHYQILDARYRYLHHRPTVTERCEKQRNAYRKRRNRWPMLAKRRRQRR